MWFFALLYIELSCSEGVGVASLIMKTNYVDRFLVAAVMLISYYNAVKWRDD